MLSLMVFQLACKVCADGFPVHSGDAITSLVKGSIAAFEFRMRTIVKERTSVVIWNFCRFHCFWPGLFGFVLGRVGSVGKPGLAGGGL